MSHLIESIAYANSTPWHGLGNQLLAKQPIEVWQKQSGLCFEIKEAPVSFIEETTNSPHGIHLFSDQKVLYRSDNKSPLSVVSKRYQVVQPKTILEFYRDLTEVSGYELETAGVLKGGRKIWALAKTNQGAIIKGNDLINAYLLLATACDGTLATTAQFTSIRVVCNNTLNIALRDQAGAVKIPHSTSFDANKVKLRLGISVSTWETFIYEMKALSNRKVNHSESSDFIFRLFNSTECLSTTTTNERAMKQVQELFDGRGRGAELSSAKGTAFGLLNAVTEYVDHQKRARTNDYRLDSAWFGAGATLKQKALEQAMSLVS
ncbi:DUF932 domain-containing protein [Undibacterium sp. Dicai25W]|uniref:DUF932 domain-containing protein n=1 Tax=Undibacterium sp. Dicai25W TaxID=3413034 RepID=UPI003BEFDBD3